MLPWFGDGVKRMGKGEHLGVHRVITDIYTDPFMQFIDILVVYSVLD